MLEKSAVQRRSHSPEVPNNENGSLLFHEVTRDCAMLNNAWWLCLANIRWEAVADDGLRLCWLYIRPFT